MLVPAVFATALESPFVFGVPTNLGPLINTPSFDGGPSLSADSLTLYFVSARPGGVGGDDLWVSRRQAKHEPWEAPVNLGSGVNSAEGDASPSISSDGLELYFDSGRPGGQGSGDIWVTTRASTSDAWARRAISGLFSTARRRTAWQSSQPTGCRCSLRPADRAVLG